MFHIRSTALPAAAVILVVSGACQDAPFAPKTPPPSRIGWERARFANGVQIFSGRAADSVANAVLAAWAKSGHPEYLAERVTTHAGIDWTSAGRSAGRRMSPVRELILDGDGGTYQDPPNILEYHQGFTFGNTSGIPGVLNASMKFVGDQGSITSSVTISGPGVSIPLNGLLTEGAGTSVYCADAVFGSCSNTRQMEATLTVPSAPTCDARASGSIVFSAMNVGVVSSGTIGLPLGTGGTASPPASSTGYVNNTSSACGATPPDPGTGGYNPGGPGADPPPTSPPTTPPPPDYRPPILGDDGYCEYVQWWSHGVLQLEKVTCYNE